MPVSMASVRDQARWADDLPAMRLHAYKVIDRIDGAPPGLQLASLAVALAAACEACGLDPHVLVRNARNALHDLDSPYTHEMRALRAYAEHEIARKPGAPTGLHLNVNR